MFRVLKRPTPHLADPLITFYGCTRCQRNHFEGTFLYRAHRSCQSKHGLQRMSRRTYFAYVADQN